LGQIFAADRVGVRLFNALVRGEPLNSCGITKFGLKKVTLFYCMVHEKHSSKSWTTTAWLRSAMNRHMKRRERRTDITVANAALHYMYFVRPKISGEYDTLMFLRRTNSGDRRRR